MDRRDYWLCVGMALVLENQHGERRLLGFKGGRVSARVDISREDPIFHIDEYPRFLARRPTGIDLELEIQGAYGFALANGEGVPVREVDPPKELEYGGLILPGDKAFAI